MTTIVVVRKGDTAVIAADSLTTFGTTRLAPSYDRHPEKITAYGDSFIGVCGVCKVCEQRCPTHAIEGSRIDFKECVRCNVCEVKLIQKAGVCRHDMGVVRSRLVELKVGTKRGVAAR